MIILDENIREDQRQLLASWRIRVRQIGHGVGRRGMKDEQILPLLHRLQQPTFFTRDLGFYAPHLRHPQYALVCLAVSRYEVASFVRRFLRHPEFRTQARRSGRVIQLQPRVIRCWRWRLDVEEVFEWETGIARYARKNPC